MTDKNQVSNTDLLTPELIAPEGLEVAESYLSNAGDSRKVAQELDLPMEVVEKQLKTPEVKGYVNRMFNEVGFRNRFRVFGLLDQLVNMKLDEMQETGLGTSMDIVELLKTVHNMKMQELKMEAELTKASQTSAPTTQTNVQINNTIPGSDDPGYMNVLEMLTKKGK